MSEQERPSQGSQARLSMLVQGGPLAAEVVAFWRRYPDYKFAESTICCALDCRRLDLEQAMKGMVEVGLVDMRVHDGMSFYSLTRDRRLRQRVVGALPSGR